MPWKLTDIAREQNKYAINSQYYDVAYSDAASESGFHLPFLSPQTWYTLYCLSVYTSDYLTL